MTTIMPQGELLKRAVKWIDEKQAQTGESMSALIDQAAMNFNLSPKDATFLAGFFREREGTRQD